MFDILPVLLVRSAPVFSVKACYIVAESCLPLYKPPQGPVLSRGPVSPCRGVLSCSPCCCGVSPVLAYPPIRLKGGGNGRVHCATLLYTVSISIHCLPKADGRYCLFCYFLSSSVCHNCLPHHVFDTPHLQVYRPRLLRAVDRF